WPKKNEIGLSDPSLSCYQENRALARRRPLAKQPSKNLRLLFPRTSFLLSRPPPRGTVQKNLSTNPRPFCKWSPPQRALIGSLPFLGLSFRRQRFLMLEISDPFHHVH
ncbi:hypothetical protein AVEN_198071-1, partial [Araneus ventricosus]